MVDVETPPRLESTRGAVRGERVDLHAIRAVRIGGRTNRAEIVRETEAPTAVPAPAGKSAAAELEAMPAPHDEWQTRPVVVEVQAQCSTFDRWGGDVSAAFFSRSAASNAAREPADASSGLWLCAETDRDVATSSSTTIHDELSTSKHLSTAPTSNEDAPR